jgi:hypothetical protein
MALALFGCRSVKKTTKEVYEHKDSTVYTSVTTVDIDTVIVPSDTSVVEATLTKDEFGKLYIESIKQDKGKDISISYTVEKTPEGKTKIRVQAVSDQKEVLSQNKITEVASTKVEEKQAVVIQTTKKKGISPWNLAWLIPLLLIGIVIYLKRKTIAKYLPF